MFKTKNLSVVLLIAAVLFAQVGTVLAAPQTQDTTPITGTIQSIAVGTDGNGDPVVIVTVLLDDMVTTQTVNLSVDTAVGLGLLELDPVTGEPVLDPVTGLPVADESQVGQPVEIDPTAVLPDEEPAEESTNPISALLAAFFGEDAGVIDAYHQDGFGFGVIAQAMWMSKNVEGDASLTGLILEAKQSGDYSALFPEGTENIPTNWGQLKKMLSDKKNNLGVIVSGHANSDDSTELSTQQNNGNGNGQGKGKDNNPGKGKGKGHNK
ncbi:MAG: hypothetical protein C3F07_07855 [Anaerolineales bacterium]|nr:hypothetical protein [Anaerolineae bacterium]PWB74313.1 MAG: hypothetical protein C3F07_07855 [Anaerolineales bacterium]